MMFLLRENAGAHAGGRRPPSVRGPRPGAPPEIVLDLSRLVSRVLHPSPTGIDRVEMAYARHLLARIPERLLFGAVHPCGLYGHIPHDAACEFLGLTEYRWEEFGVLEPAMARRRRAIRSLLLMRPRPVSPPAGRRVLMQASPHHLDRPNRVSAKLAREQARLICLVHDLIPISHPEFARPGGTDRHRRRLHTLERFAAGLLVNSQATLETFAANVGELFPDRPIRVAHLGTTHPATYQRATHQPAEPPGRPYFVCIGTIEPRKNHLLLLNIWRSLVDALGPDQTPLLYLVGRRGWENENVVDMLDRCGRLRDAVVELDRLPDVGLRRLMAGARAVLMPSFAEGFGLPIVEALAAGVPVLASDLPAHREAGGAAPDYLDPIDGASWREAILAYAARCSPRREAQVVRLASWQPVSWDRHIDVALDLAEEVAAC